MEQNFAKKFNAVISSSRKETKKRKRPTEQEIFTNKKEVCMHTVQNCLPFVQPQPLCYTETGMSDQLRTVL